MTKLYFASTIFLLVITTGCWNEGPVIITKDYVINPNWDEVDNSFSIVKLSLKDSSKAIYLKAPASKDLFSRLVEDTSFLFRANVEYNGEAYDKRKVYFNRDNGFLWRRNPYSVSGFKTIGELQQENWYLLAGLSRFRIFYYIFLDTSDSLHVYKVSGMTNI